MTQDISILDFCSLTECQFATLRMLKVTDRQEILGKSFIESIEDWENEPRESVLGLCIIMNNEPIGLALFRKKSPPQDQTASIHGLKIALPWQRRGYGHQAFRLAIAYLKSKWPEVRSLRLAVDAENTPAISIYRGFGMKDSGPIFEGSNGKAHHMELLLDT